MEEDKASFVELAKLCEQAERYEDMVEAMKKVTSFKEDLSTEERNLLSVAYKNVVGSRRSAWRVVSSLEDRVDDDDEKNLRATYKGKIADELSTLCNEVITLLDDALIPNAKQSENHESVVFYLKMKEIITDTLSKRSRMRRKISEFEESLRGCQGSAAMSSCLQLIRFALVLALNFLCILLRNQRQPWRSV